MKHVRLASAQSVARSSAYVFQWHASCGRARMAKRKREEEAQPATAPTSDPASNPDRDRVAERAYELYLARGGGDGQAMEDWLVAEMELRGRAGRRDES